MNDKFLIVSFIIAIVLLLVVAIKLIREGIIIKKEAKKSTLNKNKLTQK